MSLPSVQTMLFAGVGFIAPPMVEGFAGRFLPASITSNKVGRYAVRIGSVLALSWATRQFVGNEEAKNVLVGGSVYVLSTAVADFVPSLLAGNQMAAYVGSNAGGATAPRRRLAEYVPDATSFAGSGGNLTRLSPRQTYGR